MREVCSVTRLFELFNKGNDGVVFDIVCPIAYRGGTSRSGRAQPLLVPELSVV